MAENDENEQYCVLWSDGKRYEIKVMIEAYGYHTAGVKEEHAIRLADELRNQLPPRQRVNVMVVPISWLWRKANDYYNGDK